jgi:hypothetical protein
MLYHSIAYYSYSTPLFHITYHNWVRPSFAKFVHRPYLPFPSYLQLSLPLSCHIMHLTTVIIIHSMDGDKKGTLVSLISNNEPTTRVQFITIHFIPTHPCYDTVFSAIITHANTHLHPSSWIGARCFANIFAYYSFIHSFNYRLIGIDCVPHATIRHPL